MPEWYFQVVFFFSPEVRNRDFNISFADLKTKIQTRSPNNYVLPSIPLLPSIKCL